MLKDFFIFYFLAKACFILGVPVFLWENEEVQKNLKILISLIKQLYTILYNRNVLKIIFLKWESVLIISVYLLSDFSFGSQVWALMGLNAVLLMFG